MPPTLIQGIYVPDSPDGRIPDEFYTVVRMVDEADTYRWTGVEGEYRVVEETPYFYDQNTNADNLAPPNNHLISERSGWKVPVSEGLVEEWNGGKVAKWEWEPRHPLDFVRGRAEKSNPSDSPESPDTFQEDVYPNGVSLDDLDP